MRSRSVVAVACLALAIAVALDLPPARRQLEPVRGADTGDLVRGVWHVHSDRSDGTGSVETIAAAAARAGLSFVVVTDHGDGTRSPARPRYLSGVLCIDALEVSTTRGHVIALDIGRTPYRLAGDATGVVEDVARLGGATFVAHPDSPKSDLRWAAWQTPVDGLEWLNADSEWRDERVWTLARALASYGLRGPESLARVFERPATTLSRWDEFTRRRPMVGLAGTDAHARIGIGAAPDPYRNDTAIRLPSYESAFRALSITLDGVTLTGDAAADAARVVGAIRGGRVYSTIDALAGEAQVRFRATSGGVAAGPGERLRPGAPVRLEITSNAPPDATVRIFKDGAVVHTAAGAATVHDAGPGEGTYRVEIALPGAPGDPSVPWVVSNPIYVGRLDAPPAAAPPPLTDARWIYRDGPAAGWTIERSQRSAGAFDVVPTPDGTQVSVRFAIAGAASESPYVGVSVPVDGLPDATGLRLMGRASAPMRLSVQVRVPDRSAGARWVGSVYLDDVPREAVVRFADMQPAGPAAPSTIPLADVRSVLLVVDGVNTPLGTAGTFAIDELAVVSEVPGR